MTKKSKYVAENCMGDGKADLLHLHVDKKILKTISVRQKRFLQEHQRQHAMATEYVDTPIFIRKPLSNTLIKIREEINNGKLSNKYLRTITRPMCISYHCVWSQKNCTHARTHGYR